MSYLPIRKFIEGTDKAVVVMRGIAGSGKSSVASTLMDIFSGLKPVKCSSDDFFMENGEYRFDYKRLPETHGKCLRKFTECLVCGSSLVVVDNTNLSLLDIAPYMRLADAFGYRSLVVEVWCEPWDAAVRNKHGVPTEVVLGMWRVFNSEVLPAHWNRISVDNRIVK